MTRKQQISKFWDDVLFYTLWLVALVGLCFAQANTLRKFRAEQNKCNNFVEICIEKSC